MNIHWPHHTITCCPLLFSHASLCASAGVLGSDSFYITLSPFSLPSTPVPACAHPIACQPCLPSTCLPHYPACVLTPAYCCNLLPPPFLPLPTAAYLFFPPPSLPTTACHRTCTPPFPLPSYPLLRTCVAYVHSPHINCLPVMPVAACWACLGGWVVGGWARVLWFCVDSFGVCGLDKTRAWWRGGQVMTRQVTDGVVMNRHLCV